MAQQQLQNLAKAHQELLTQIISSSVDTKIHFQSSLFRYLLNCAFFLSNSKDDECYQQLLNLADSVILDHLEGGFFNLPQQETSGSRALTKSLTVNGEFINLFTDASGHYFEGLFSIPAIESAQWIINTLQSPDGAFFQEATSDQNPENYYSLTSKIINDCLDKDSHTVFVSAFILANLPGSTISVLSRKRCYQQIADDTSLHIKQVPLLLESARQQMINHRNINQLPTLNKQIVCKDNGKIISALFNAARQFNRDDFATAACLALNDLKLKLWDGTKLQQTVAADTIATAEDLLLLINALLNRLQYQWCDEYYKWLLQLADLLIEHSEQIIPAIISAHIDNVLSDLYDLFLLSANDCFRKLAETVDRDIQAALQHIPEKQSDLLLVLLKQAKPHHLIVVRGSKYESAFWQQQLATGFKPNQHIFAIANTHTGPDPEKFSTSKSTQAVACQINEPQKTYSSLDGLLKDFP